MRTLLLWLSLSLPLLAQSASIEGPKDAEIGQLVVLDSKNSSGDYLKWIVPSGTQYTTGSNGIALVFSSPGMKQVHLAVSNMNGIAVATWDISVIGSDPNPPDPPKPPDPKPPNPDNPAPIPAPGFRVLITYDSTSGVPDAFVAKAVREYLVSKCVVGPDKKTPEFRIWDISTNTVHTSKLWQDAFSRKKDTVPWILISDGKTGYEGPAPVKTDELLTLLKKYGG